MVKRWQARTLLEQLESRLVLSAAHFAVVGDYGTGGTAEQDVFNRINSWAPELIITTGDNNYSVGASGEIDAHIGQYYHSYIGNYTNTGYGAGSPGHNRFFPSMGNHDWGNQYPSPYSLATLPYTQYFTLPGTPEPGSGFTLPSPNPNTNERYYTFILGPVQFFALDSDYDPASGISNEPDGVTPNSIQGQWLQSALAASTATWKVVYFHHAAYSSANSHGSNSWMQWPFAQWGASVVMSGHDHTYERILNPSDGLLYFVEGTGGQSLNGFATVVNGSKKRDNSDYGAMDVHADDSHITFEHYTRTGTLIDTYTLYVPTSVPAAPTGLTVSVGSSSQLNLSWTDNSTNVGANQETGTRIERSTDNVNFTEVGVAAADATTYTDSGLTPTVTYYYRVRSYNVLGNGAYSGVAWATVPVSTTSTLITKGASWKYLVTASAPSASWKSLGFNDSSWPSGPAELGYGDTSDGRPEATQIGFGPDANNKYVTTYFRKTINIANPATFAALTLNLMRDDGAVVYINGQEVWRNNMPNGSIGYSTLATNNITGAAEATYYQANFSSSLLVAGSNTIAVEVHQQFLSSADLSFDMELIGSTVALPAPTNLTATTASSTQINLAWTDNFANETGYKIERSLDGITFDTTVATAGAGATSYSDTGLTPGTRYFYRVRAVSGTNGDESSPSNVANAYTQLLVTFLPAGASWKYLVTAAAPLATWITAGFNDAAWPAGAAELGYNTDAADTADTQVTTLGYGGNTANKYITTYFRTTFSVTNANQFSALTLNLLCDDGAVVYINGVEVKRYNIAASGTIGWSTLATTAIGSAAEEAFTAYSLSPGVLANGTNTIAVEVHQSSVSSSDIGFNLSLVGTVAIPTAPTSLVAAPAVSGPQVNLTWADAAYFENGFKIERSVDGVNFTQIGTAAANATSYSDTTVAVNTVYTYRLRSTNAVGDSAPGNLAGLEIEEAIISGIVFDDADGDGVRDEGDFGLSGWTAYIDANNNSLLDPGERSTTTNSFGEYDLGGLFGGTYRIRHIPVAGWTASAPSSYMVTLNNSTTVGDRNFGQTPPTSFAGTAGNDTYTVRLAPDGQNVEIWNGPATGTPTYRILQSRINTLSFTLGDGNDSVTIDGSNGTPVGNYGLAFDGGAGTNTFTLNGGTYFFGTSFFNVSGDLNLVIGPGTNVTFGDPPQNTLTAPLTLNGTVGAMSAAIAAPISAPVVTLSDGGLPVGPAQNVYVGTVPLSEPSLTHVFVLTNVGDVPADLGAVTLPVGYTVVGAAPTHLEPGESANLVVALQTRKQGPASGPLVVPVLGGQSAGVNLAGAVTAPVGTGLIGHYFASTDFSKLKLTRVDPTIAFDWGKNAPVAALPKDRFSVRWTGQVLPLEDGVYTFYLRASDGVRLWVDGQQIINRWTTANTVAESRGSIWLSGGTKHSVILEYFEDNNNASVALTWSSPTLARQAIPTRQLFAVEASLTAPLMRVSSSTLASTGIVVSTLIAPASPLAKATESPRHERKSVGDPLTLAGESIVAKNNHAVVNDLAVLSSWK